jgi:murein DD-endopeptidase MepM/ murein hydrolase activator NlpD
MKVSIYKIFRFFHCPAPCYTLLTLGLFLCFSVRTGAQEMVSPLDIPLYLSGNFGELRSDHFHAGLDIKTQGITGLPVKAVKAGFISRISVGPSGFGRAVYIIHPDGTTTVYGHLDRFASQIESAVRDSQYIRESFSVNLIFSASDFPVRQGEVIAYSGNTGSSGGPHLHFELRDTETDRVRDPLPALKNYLRDTRPPEIQSLLFIPLPGEGVVNGSTEKQSIEVVRDRNGRYVLAKPVSAWGAFGIAVKAYDRMDATTNIYGVKEIRLRVDNALLFHSVIESFLFSESRYLNSFIDWEDWRDNRSFYMKSFIEPGNRLQMYRTRMSGLLSVRESKPYECEYMLQDVFGNTSILAFTITGEERLIPEVIKEGILFPHNRDNEYVGKGVALNIPRGNLYTDIYLNPDTIQTRLSTFAPLYSFGVRAPLHNPCQLTLVITNDTYPDKSKYGVVSVVNNRAGWMGGVYEQGRLNVRVREIGQYTVAIDTVAPVVTPLNRAGWTANKRISFRITDNLSGIGFYQGKLDGQFVLFEYDAKTNSLFCIFDEQRMKKGRQTLTLTVRDGAGNETRVNYDVVL